MKSKLFSFLGMAGAILPFLLVVQSYSICTSCQSTIPGTDLKTRTSYKLGLKKFPSGTVTWTAKSNGTYNFVQIDNDPDHYEKYQQGGDWYQDSLWEFIPRHNKNGDENGWYALRNRGRPSAYAAYETTEPSNTDRRSYHVVLEQNWDTKDIHGEYFLKPIRIFREGKTFYQLKFKNLPRGTVTWTAKKHEDKGSRYIQVDDRSAYYAMYADEGEWYEDSLFTISSTY